MNAFALSLLIDKINDKYFFKSKKIIIKESTEGRLSTYEYLLLYLLFLNKYSSKTFNDTSQYPIFTWLIFKCSNDKKIKNIEI